MLFLVQGQIDASNDPTPEFLQASKDTLEQLTEWQKSGKVKAGGVFIGPMGVCFIVDVESNEDLHMTLTTMPSFRYADWEVMPLIPFHRDIEMSLDDALERSKKA